MFSNKQCGIDRGYRQLASAIIGRAILDYYEADGTENEKAVKESIEEFVNSPWFGDLTEIRPNYVIDRLHSGDTKNLVFGLVA